MLPRFHELVSLAEEQISFVHFIPTIITGLVVGIWFFVKRLFQSVDKSSDQIMKLTLELGGVQKDLANAQKDIDALGAIIREMKK